MQIIRFLPLLEHRLLAGIVVEINFGAQAQRPHTLIGIPIHSSISPDVRTYTRRRNRTIAF